MNLYALTIESVDKYTAGGGVTVAIPEGGTTKFSLKAGVTFQPCRSTPLKITEMRLTEELFTLVRPIEDDMPWRVTVYVETDQAVIHFRSFKSFAGYLVFLCEGDAADHSDRAGEVSNISLWVNRPRGKPPITPP